MGNHTYLEVGMEVRPVNRGGMSPGAMDILCRKVTYPPYIIHHKVGPWIYLSDSRRQGFNAYYFEPVIPGPW